jgi:hypothetical protein
MRNLLRCPEVSPFIWTATADSIIESRPFSALCASTGLGSANARYSNGLWQVLPGMRKR